MAKSKRPRRDELKPRGDRRNSRSTVSGPAHASYSPSPDDLELKLIGTNELASRMPFNLNKPREYDAADAISPSAGETVDPPDPVVTASTVT